MGLKFILIFVCTIFYLIDAESQYSEGKIIRSARSRGPSKRNHGSIIYEDSYAVSNSKRPSYIEGGNQWKPLSYIPVRSSSIPKYRSKPNYATKYQSSEEDYSVEYQPKPSHQPTTANFIASQSLQVADLTDSSESKSNPIYKKSKYQYVPKKNYNPQYEVYEEIDDDAPSYSTQNHYRYHGGVANPVVKSSKLQHKPSQYSEVIGAEKHIHHVHYHDTMEEAIKAARVNKHQERIYRPKTSRRHY